jgi:regulatory protein
VVRTITALKIQTRNPGRVNVYLDARYAFALSLNTAQGLCRGQRLGPDEIDRLKAADQPDAAFDRALRFLARRRRSIRETERHLRSKGYPAAVVGPVIQRLREYRYLDDAEFARQWVTDRERFRPRSDRALRWELRQKGVGASEIDQALAGLDEAASARAALQGRLNRWQTLARQDFKAKVLGFLGRRGFSYEIAEAVFEAAWAARAGGDPGEPPAADE